MSLKGMRVIKNVPTGISGTSMAPAGTALDPTSKKQKEDLDRINQDIILMNQKIADGKGESLSAREPPTYRDDSSSSFVSNMRSLTDAERRLRDIKDVKLANLEALLEKIGEYDRIILAKTMPVENPALRRKSIGADLCSLPTHLRVIDRLLDLFNQSKRTTVIRTTVQGESEDRSDRVPQLPSQPDLASAGLIDSLKDQCHKLTEQNRDLEKKCSTSEKEVEKWKSFMIDSEKKLNTANTTISSLQSQNHSLQEQFEKQNKLIKEFQSKPVPAASNDDELERLRQQLSALRKEYQSLENKLESETSINKSMLNNILSKATRLQQHDDHHNAGLVEIDAPEEYKRGFQLLDKAIESRFASLKSEISLLMSVKMSLENELSSVNLQRDMIQQDLSTLTEAHSALTAAYHSLSYETATMQRKSLDSDLVDTVEGQKRTILKLEGDLLEQRLQLKAFEQWPTMVAELEVKLRGLTDEKSQLELQLKAMQDEISHYKKLTDNLKAKLRELTEKSGGDSKDFMDTFEEVMQEEMMTMKSAFENKLKQARDEADRMSKRHQQEILRMQSSSPFSLLNRSNPSSSK